MLHKAIAPDLLDLLDTGGSGDSDFYCQYARHRGGPVLVLMSGTGRIAISIAKQGVPVIGVDPDPALVEHAKKKAQQAGASRVLFARADATHFISDSKHPLVIIPAGGLLRLLTLEEQRSALSSVRGALAIGGRLLLDLPLLQPGVLAPEQPTLRRLGGGEERMAVLQRVRRYDSARQLTQDLISCEWVGSDGMVEGKEYASLSERYLTPGELELLLEVTGFEAAFFGGFDRHPLMPGAARIVVEAERKD